MFFQLMIILLEKENELENIRYIENDIENISTIDEPIDICYHLAAKARVQPSLMTL